MSAPLMISVAGIRGIVGESLTPPVLARFAAAFAHGLEPGPVVVGRDARRSGPMVYRAVAAGLMAAGRDVIDLGLATTPATEVAVEELHAAGGIILTASHNPAEWNALKLLSGRGEFLDAETGGAVRQRYESGDRLWATFDRLGSESAEPRALEWHLERVLALPFIDAAAIRRRHLRAVVDGCASVGGVAVPRLLRELGCEVVELDCAPDGRFTRELEPLPEHLGALGAAVRDARADFGVARHIGAWRNNRRRRTTAFLQNIEQTHPQLGGLDLTDSDQGMSMVAEQGPQIGIRAQHGVTKD